MVGAGLAPALGGARGTHPACRATARGDPPLPEQEAHSSIVGAGLAPALGALFSDLDRAIYVVAPAKCPSQLSKNT